MVGVDRLDYIKGMPQKLHAFEVFLTEHPEWVGKIVLIQVAVPSREDVEEYQNLRALVNELVGRINGKFGTAEFMPVHFMHKSVAFDELVALYEVSDVCIVSSTRDGMNLVAFEYIASQGKRHGALILSEFAGAAQSLNGSLVCNPWNTAQLAAAIHEAVRISDEQRAINYAKLEKYVNEFTSAWWGATFVNELVQVTGPPQKKLRIYTDKLLKFLKGNWDAADGFDGSSEATVKAAVDEPVESNGETTDDSISPASEGSPADLTSSIESSALEDK